MAASAAALCFIFSSQATAQSDKDPVLALDTERVQLNRVVLMPIGLPERATGEDLPIDMSAGNASAQAMVNSGQVSPAAGAAGGILGALVVAAIDAGIDANRNGKIERMLTAQEFDARLVFEEALVSALSQGQLEASQASEKREKNAFIPVKADPNATHDASVDVLVRQYGFTIDKTAWYPSVFVQVKINDAKTGKLLMNDALSYGRPGLQAPIQMNPALPADPNVGSTTIIVPYVTGNVFKNVDAYTQDEPERAAAALTQALQRTAKAAASLILAATPPPAQSEAARKNPAAEPDTTAGSSDIPDTGAATETL